MRLLRGPDPSVTGVGGPTEAVFPGDLGLGEGSLADIDSESSESIDRDGFPPSPESSCKMPYT